MVGPAKIATLLKYAALCGVGNSLGFLRKRSASLVTLAESVVGPVETHVRDHPDSPIVQVHVFPFGGIKNTAKWLEERGSWTSSGTSAQYSIA